MGKSDMNISNLYQNRFKPEEQKRKEIIWQTLCKHFFQHYISAEDTVLDIGAGFCEFINHIECRNKYALDINPDIKFYADDDVTILQGSVLDIQSISDGSVDIVFASNFFEHLPDKDIFFKTLFEIKRVLRTGGKILILQPNIAVLNGRYWDFFDHHIPLTHKSVSEALVLSGFRILEVRARFLPYTTKSFFPMNPILTRLYLLFRPLHYIIGGQAWIVGEKP
ncbi:MAG: class I SAM-dependent methyltransferase [Anaerolineales bacterium]|nr:MAG: class I SAM-dependent methyltransferase [Anaerolineales bacterium]